MENKNSIKIDELLASAKQYHQNNNFVDALKFYEDILSINSKHFEAIFFLGVLKAQTKKFEEAKELLNKAIKIKPEIPDLYNNMGLILREMKDYDQLFFSIIIHDTLCVVVAYLDTTYVSLSFHCIFSDTLSQSQKYSWITLSRKSEVIQKTKYLRYLPS